MSKIDNFETLIARYSDVVRSILRDTDEKVRGFEKESRLPVAIQRYTTDVPDVRYRVLVSGVPKPVFLRVLPKKTKVRMEIETVDDPSGRTEPREKSGRWKNSPRSDREFIVTRMISEKEKDLLRKSMLSSMSGPDVRK